MYKKYRWRDKAYERSRFSLTKVKRSRTWPLLALVILLVGTAAYLFATAGSSVPANRSSVPGGETVPGGAAPAQLNSNSPEGVAIAAVGDVLLSRKIADTISDEGWKAPFRNSAKILQGSDFAFCNLETPAAFAGSPFPGKDPDVTFRAPPGALFGLKSGGFSIVSVANNHINDYGPAALKETLEALDILGIAHCGAGVNAAEARRPAIMTAKGLRFAFLGYAEPMWSVVEAGTEPGVALLNPDQIIADIQAARAEADVVVVSLHWGEEHQGAPRESDRALARTFVDAGANLIIGHHPHVLQGAEFYREALILYSLGNFIFDMVSSKTYQSASALIRFEGKRPVEVRFRPILIDRLSFAPDLAVGEDATRIASLIQTRCAAVGGATTIAEDGTVVLRAPLD